MTAGASKNPGFKVTCENGTTAPVSAGLGVGGGGEGGFQWRQRAARGPAKERKKEEVRAGLAVQPKGADTRAPHWQSCSQAEGLLAEDSRAREALASWGRAKWTPKKIPSWGEGQLLLSWGRDEQKKMDADFAKEKQGF